MFRLSKILVSSCSRIISTQPRFSTDKDSRQMDTPHFGVLNANRYGEGYLVKSSQAIKKTYLSSLLKDEKEFQATRTGIFYEGKLLITLPTRTDQGSSIWVHYFLVTGESQTFLSPEALKGLGCFEVGKDNYTVFINKKQCMVKVSHPSFKEVNVLGMEFLPVVSKFIVTTCRKNLTSPYIEGL